MEMLVTRTLLFDLDDTLLSNNIDAFLPAYLQAISIAVHPLVSPDNLVSSLMEGTRRMVQNRRPDRTLQETFAGSFYPTIGATREKLEPVFDRFYLRDYPALNHLTRLKPEAVRLVESAVERGYRLAVATNPLFPRTAICQRLEWAGLPSSKIPFEVISSYETFHFSKPDPAYFAELLGQMGWPEGPVVVIGDNLENDIRAARLLGLPAFWVTRPNITQPIGPLGPTASGRIRDFLPWLESTPPEQLLPDYNKLAAMLAILRATPAVFDTQLRVLKRRAWNIRPRPGEWAPNEILCHLRDVDQEVNLPRLQKIIQEDNPFLPGMDTDPWAEERHYLHQDGAQALRSFTAARLKMLSLLEGLSPKDWQRTARHAILGPTRLEELVSITAAHDRLHVRQLEQEET